MGSRPAAFITGASRGIGRGIAIELARSGFDIAGNARSFDPASKEKGLAETGARVAELGAAFLPVPGDVADLSVHGRLLDAVLERFGRLDLLVNNAGVAPEERRDILETTPESFDRVMAVNARGAFFLTQRFARWMVKQAEGGPRGGGVAGAGAVGPAGPPAGTPAIVFITSISARLSTPARAEYCISKAALSHAAAIFAHRLAEHGINVYEVRPGITRTDMTAPFAEVYNALIMGGIVLQKRWGLPQDVGRAVASLARGDFAFSTGLVVEVSGGMNVQRL